MFLYLINPLSLSLSPCLDFDRPYEAKLDMTLKKFTSKPIISLSVIPEHDIFLALTS